MEVSRQAKVKCVYIMEREKKNQMCIKKKEEKKDGFLDIYILHT